jgi:hypothetical protein
VVLAVVCVAVVSQLGRVTVVVWDLGRLVDYQGTQRQSVFQLIEPSRSE